MSPRFLPLQRGRGRTGESSVSRERESFQDVLDTSPGIETLGDLSLRVSQERFDYTTSSAFLSSFFQVVCLPLSLAVVLSKSSCMLYAKKSSLFHFCPATQRTKSEKFFSGMIGLPPSLLFCVWRVEEREASMHLLPASRPLSFSVWFVFCFFFRKCLLNFRS